MRRRGFSATKTVLGLICVMYAITYIDRVNVSTAASVFQKELHFTSVQVGLVFSAFAYPYLIFQIIGGWVSDRFGARLTLTVSAIIWALATLLTGLAGGLASHALRPRSAWVWRRRDVSRRYPGDVGLDGGGKARILSGNHPFRCATGECLDAATGGLADGARDVAWIVHHPRRHEPRLGCGMGLVLPQRPRRTRRHHVRGVGSAAQLCAAKSE